MNKLLAVLAVVLLTMVTGCSDSPSAVTTPPARVGECYAKLAGPPVSCAQPHIAQTVFVGHGSVPASADALKRCRRAQERFLGQDFNTRLDLRLWVASDRSWYRCDTVVRTSTRAATSLQHITGSLQGVFHDGASVNLQACLGAPYHPRNDQPYVSCAHPHVAQELFVAPAIGTLTEPFPPDAGQRAASACHATASAARMLAKGRTVTAFYPDTLQAWTSGDRTADCWVTAKSGTLPAIGRTPR